MAGLTSPPPQGRQRVNAAQRREMNNPMKAPQGRVNRAERRAINQGMMQAPQGYQGPQRQDMGQMSQQRPQQPMPQRPQMQQPPQTGGNSYAPQQMQPMQRPPMNNWFNQMPQGFPQGFNPKFGGYPQTGGGLQYQGQQAAPYPQQQMGMQPQSDIQYNGGSQQQPMSQLAGQFYRG